MQAANEDQPFDLEAFFAPLPDAILNVWDAEEARQARLDAEEQQLRLENGVINLWAGRNLHTPVLEVPAEEPIAHLEEIIAIPEVIVS